MKTKTIDVEVDQALEAYTQSTGLSICVKLFQKPFLGDSMLEFVSRKWGLHCNPFCLEIKKTQTPQCRSHDLNHVPALCYRKRRIFTNVCHAGAEEIIVPLFQEGVLCAAIFIGQYCRAKGRHPLLQEMKKAQRERAMGLARLLQAYMDQLLRTHHFNNQSSSGYRNESIVLFLRSQLRSNPRLPDLARHLGLSVSRTSHLIQEITGGSFISLRDSLRVERAKSLLANTCYKIAHVAAECGIGDVQYFHRFFRRQAGVTPAAYRRLNALGT